MSQDITQHRYTDGKPNLRRFHQARWDEPIIFELSCKGQRGILVPEVEEEISDAVGDVLAALPDKMRGKPLRHRVLSPDAIPQAERRALGDGRVEIRLSSVPVYASVVIESVP